MARARAPPFRLFFAANSVFSAAASVASAACAYKKASELKCLVQIAQIRANELGAFALVLRREQRFLRRGQRGFGRLRVQTNLRTDVFSVSRANKSG